MSKLTIIRCDHCNKEVGGHYRGARIQVFGIGFDKELELCDECVTEFTNNIMDYIQPKHYKH